LRAKVLTPKRRDGIFAKFDLIHRDYRMILTDCQLRLDPWAPVAYVRVYDTGPVAGRYLIEAAEGEPDFLQMLDDMALAVCEHFDVPDDGHDAAERLYHFVKSPAWKALAAAQGPAASLRDALQIYVTASRSRHA
jgi:hypothetical protein